MKIKISSYKSQGGVEHGRFKIVNLGTSSALMTANLEAADTEKEGEV